MVFLTIPPVCCEFVLLILRTYIFHLEIHTCIIIWYREIPAYEHHVLL